MPNLLRELTVLARCEDLLKDGRYKLKDSHRKAILDARLSLIAKGADMARIARRYPFIDRIIGCDADGNPVWGDQ